MSQKFEVSVRATRPHQYAIGGKYRLSFGNPSFQETNQHCPYLFHCLRLSTIEKDGTWIYAGIGEFDDHIWRVISAAMIHRTGGEEIATPIQPAQEIPNA